MRGDGSGDADDVSTPEDVTTPGGVTADGTGGAAASPSGGAGDGQGFRSTVARLEDQLLGGPRTLTLQGMAERAGSSPETVRRFWHALGLPTTEADAVAYTEEDAAAVAMLTQAAREHGLSQETAVTLIRAIGHTTDRLVLWQVEALVEHLAERHDLDDVSARLTVLDRLGGVAPVLERQLVHAWRRQLAAIAARFAAEFVNARSSGDEHELPLARAVGFADMVAFTTRTARLGSQDLAAFVQGFETQARDVVTSCGGRVVKTIGDAVLFVADDAVTGAQVALGLAEAFGASTPTPVRVGWVWGRVLSRFGDVFGPSVNVAARLTDEAAPGTVLLDPATADQLQGLPGLRMTELEERDVPGVGAVRPTLLERVPVG